jgi:glycosyltransferase involved in cell wall biosynthesis
MRNIVYLSPFSRTEITGGIKTVFRHVELLRGMGIEATVFAPDGMPTWFSSQAKLNAKATLTDIGDLLAEETNLVVFPETLRGVLAQAARLAAPATKALLCQNQYYAFNELLATFTYEQLGFVKLLTVSDVAKGFLERVFAPATFEVLPVWVDPAVFFPRDKQLRIAVMPSKLPAHYELIRNIFLAKFPTLRHIPWDVIVDKPEAEVAERLGHATILLSLNNMESVGLVPLEAMASGCLVVGFHGYGGLEYATLANGVWTRPDYLEETADALAEALRGIERGDERWQVMRKAGEATARRFDRRALEEALKKTLAPGAS